MQRREFITLFGSAPWRLRFLGRSLLRHRQRPSIASAHLASQRSFDEKSPFGSILVRVLAQRGYTLGLYCN
jgi:hypothetical protein